MVVKVHNKLLSEGVSIHWHGMIQRNTPWMDGVSGVTQCAIHPQETFTYRYDEKETATIKRRLSGENPKADVKEQFCGTNGTTNYIHLC